MEKIEEVHKVPIPEVLKGVGMGCSFLHPLDGCLLTENEEFETINLFEYRPDLGLILDEHNHQAPHIIHIQHIILIGQTEPRKDQLYLTPLLPIEPLIDPLKVGIGQWPSLLPLPNLQPPKELLNLRAFVGADVFHQKPTNDVEGDFP